jgi:hypothetical protein
LLTAVLLVPCHLRDRYDVRGNAIDRLVRIYFTLVTCGPTLNNLSHRNVVSKTITPSDSDEVVYIGRSEIAMRMRVVSSWVCIILYSWSLLAPVIMPDR